MVGWQLARWAATKLREWTQNLWWIPRHLIRGWACCCLPSDGRITHRPPACSTSFWFLDLELKIFLILIQGGTFECDEEFCCSEYLICEAVWSGLVLVTGWPGQGPSKAKWRVREQVKPHVAPWLLSPVAPAAKIKGDSPTVTDWINLQPTLKQPASTATNLQVCI